MIDSYVSCLIHHQHVFYMVDKVSYSWQTIDVGDKKQGLRYGPLEYATRDII